MNEQGVFGMPWSGREYTGQMNVSFVQLVSFNTTISHYYGLYEIKFEGVSDYIWDAVLLRTPYMRIWLNKIKQLAYNQINPFRLKRVQVLELLVERHLENGGQAVSSWEIMEELYSIRWFGHPKGEAAHKRLQLFMSSLVATGEIVEDESPFCFRVKGKALDTLSSFELEERRYKEMLSLQKKMTFLTVVIALATILTVDQTPLIWSFFKGLMGQH